MKKRLVSSSAHPSLTLVERNPYSAARLGRPPARTSSPAPINALRLTSMRTDSGAPVAATAIDPRRATAQPSHTNAQSYTQ